MKSCFSPVSMALAAVLAPVCASVADEGRELARPNTGWIYRFGTTQTTIVSDINAGFRPISLQRTGSNVHDVVMVANSGVFNDPRPLTYFLQTETSLNNALAASNRRLIDVEPYTVNGSRQLLATAIDNSGSNARGWTWSFDRTPAQLEAELAANPNLRPIDLTGYSVDGTRFYSMVTTQNTGSERQTFDMHFDKAESEMRGALGNRLTGQRLVSLTMHSQVARRVSGVSIENDGTPWWFYTQLTGAQVGERLASTGSRLVSLERYDSFQTNPPELFAAVMINNSNALTTRIGEYMRGRVDSNQATTNAQFGLYFKEVGGPVLASLNADRAFEPASLMKTAHLVYAVSRFASGNDNLGATLLNDDIDHPDECPLTGQPGTSATETVDRVLRRMMERSDNNATREIQLRFGRTNINNYLRGPVGLEQSVINGTALGCLDCNLEFNVLTPREICQLFERVADGTLFSTAWQNYFYSVMEDSRDATTLDDPNRFDGAYNTMRSLISQEAEGLNLTTEERADFLARTYHVRKGGAYGLSSCQQNGGRPFQARSFAGWMRLPFKSLSGVITDREFVGATLIDFATDGPGASDALDAFPELFREQVRAALVSWDSACTTPTILLQPEPERVIRDGTAQFSVLAGVGTGAISYEWFRFGVPLVNGTQSDGSVLSGATTRTLTVSNAQNFGLYRVELTKVCGSIVSSVVTLTVVTCRADFNDDNVLDPDDLADFITAYFSPRFGLAADFDRNGTVDPDDLADFITAYFAGC